ncbi:MAG TPA: branched-chain amino acid ABC transporter permease [Stellaceae bacterium]|nr:branched-chain amino acid ABC transporter permease [Stellaceae bacterium]
MDRSARAGTIATLLIGLLITFGLPAYADPFQVMQMTLYVVLAIFALSLAFIWGVGGILCFGQGVFFGLGGYTFAICAINFGGSTGAFLMALLIPAAVAAALGYFMFYGRLNDVYLGVVTMVFSLIIWKLINSTAGPEWHIGAARLGGFNGIPSIPPLNWPGRPADALDPLQVFQIAMGLLVIVYLAMKLIKGSRYGRVAIAVRENETRAALLGYDVPFVKLVVFTFGGLVAGMAGALYAANQAFIDPNVFSLEMSAKVLVWVMAGGLSTFVGPIIATIGLQYVALFLADHKLMNSQLVLGAILCVLVLSLPNGIIPALQDAAAWLFGRTRLALAGRAPAAARKTAL